MESGDRLVSAIQAARRVFDHQNAALPLEQRDEKWQQLWDDIGSKVNSANMASSLPISLVPQKRSSCSAQLGPESGSKRIPASLEVSAPYLERRISAPAGTNPTRNTTVSSTTKFSSQTKPINIPRPQKRHNSRRLSTSCTSFTRPPFYSNSLGLINEVQSYSPDDFLAQNPDNNLATLAFTFGEALGFERGELHTTQLTVPNPPSDGSNSPDSTGTAASDPSTSSDPTAYSAAMTRASTNRPIQESFNMFGVDSGVNHVRTESIPNMLDADSNNLLSRHFPFFPSVQMKPSLSQQSGSSSDESLSSSSSSSCGADPVVIQGFPVRARPLAPKQQNDVSDPQPKIVAFQAEDGTIKQKAEIPRTTRQQPQRKTTFCEYCDAQPSGFHGDHELRRHIERHHTQIRKVWICRDASEDGTFLASCKACKNKKTYGANYNAAAHLRRAHFNPCKNKRGGRGKKSEGRGGMGGGNHPPMEELKAWMFESYEINLNGKIFIQELPPDANIADIDLENLGSFAHPVNTTVEPDFELELDQSALPIEQKHVPAQTYNSYAPVTGFQPPTSYGQIHAMPMHQHHASHYMPMQHQPHPHHMVMPMQLQHGYQYYHH